jgi:hypothetical protein
MKLSNLRIAFDPQQTFDPGAPGQPSIAYRWVRRLLEQTARTFPLRRPAFRAFGRYVLEMASDGANLNQYPPLTPQERALLVSMFHLVEPEEQALENPADIEENIFE